MSEFTKNTFIQGIYRLVFNYSSIDHRYEADYFMLMGCTGIFMHAFIFCVGYVTIRVFKNWVVNSSETALFILNILFKVTGVLSVVFGYLHLLRYAIAFTETAFCLMMEEKIRVLYYLIGFIIALLAVKDAYFIQWSCVAVQISGLVFASLAVSCLLIAEFKIPKFPMDLLGGMLFNFFIIEFILANVIVYVSGFVFYKERQYDAYLKQLGNGSSPNLQ